MLYGVEIVDSSLRSIVVGLKTRSQHAFPSLDDERQMILDSSRVQIVNPVPDARLSLSHATDQGTHLDYLLRRQLSGFKRDAYVKQLDSDVEQVVVDAIFGGDGNICSDGFMLVMEGFCLFCTSFSSFFEKRYASGGEMMKKARGLNKQRGRSGLKGICFNVDGFSRRG